MGDITVFPVFRIRRKIGRKDGEKFIGVDTISGKLPTKFLHFLFAQSRAQELLKLLDGENDFRKPNTGIAFSVRLSGMAGMSVLNYIKDNE